MLADGIKVMTVCQIIVVSPETRGRWCSAGNVSVIIKRKEKRE